MSNINEKIFMHFANEHNLSLLESEINEIKHLIESDTADKQVGS
jgi:predicted small metal-binding protein